VNGSRDGARVMSLSSNILPHMLIEPLSPIYILSSSGKLPSIDLDRLSQTSMDVAQQYI
jgi:hypothetical protein